ncbi:MAG: BMC domain-containing protein [Candidatus Latescibacterota bacterium]
MAEQALGLVETLGFVGAVAACDAALKAAQVTLKGYELATGGLVTVEIAGDVAAVQAAVAAGAEAAAQVGQLVSKHVIARPYEELSRILRKRDAGTSPPPETPERPARFETSKTSRTSETPKASDDLDGRTVPQLRKLARDTAGIGATGREISDMRKDELIRRIRTAAPRA